MSGDHTHAAGGPEDGAPRFDVWKVFDILIVASIVVVVVIGAEWLLGYIVRERLAKAIHPDTAKATADGPSS